MVSSIRISAKAKIERTQYGDRLVREAFSTAMYPDGSTDPVDKDAGPANHADTFILYGSGLDMTNDVMLRTGNATIKIRPRAYAVTARREEPYFMVYDITDLPDGVETRILNDLGTLRTNFVSSYLLDVILDRKEEIH